MQSKISSFFNSISASSSDPKSEAEPAPTVADGDDELALWENTQHQFVNTYKRRAPKSDNGNKGNETNKGAQSGVLTKPISKDSGFKPELASSGKVLNKKRSYAQFHLLLGQSDYHLKTCSTCGIQYAPGDEYDEKNHKALHKNYTHGIHFKGWQNERVVQMACTEEGRVVLVLDCDPPAQRNKVQEVIKMMEIELGGEWIFHKLCKVYLYISSQRVAGCLVAEPIKEAYRVISGATDERSDGVILKDSRSNSTTLQFGEIIFQREATKKVRSLKHDRAIVCEEEAIPALCGVRAIWVTPSNRRKGIASKLLDATRQSFCSDFTLEQSHLAFSPPTSAGNALASRYTGTASFLVYKARAVES